MSKSEEKVCAYCGTVIEDGDFIEVDGNIYCDSDCALSDGYEICEHCGEWVALDDAIVTRYSNGRYTELFLFCSDDCAASSGWFQCDDCGEWTRESIETVYGDSICESCYEDNYVTCYECDDVIRNDHAYWCESRGEYFCEDCYPGEQHPELHSYGYTPRLEFFGSTEDGTQPYLGVELETDCGNDQYNYIEELSDIEMFDRVYLTEDGSLSDCGVEVTSFPMTLEEHYSCGLWHDVRSVARSNGYLSHDARSCGLHIHIDKCFFGKSDAAKDLAALKLTRLFSRFEKQLTIFSRRMSNNWCEYNGKEYAPESGNNIDDCFAKAHDLKRKHGHRHSVAVNLQHSATIELRIFRGTLNLDTFFASLALANGLARWVKCHGTTSVESVTWYELTDWLIADASGNFAQTLENYLISKGLR